VAELKPFMVMVEMVMCGYFVADVSGGYGISASGYTRGIYTNCSGGGLCQGLFSAIA